MKKIFILLTLICFTIYSYSDEIIINTDIINTDIINAEENMPYNPNKKDLRDPRNAPPHKDFDKEIDPDNKIGETIGNIGAGLIGLEIPGSKVVKVVAGATATTVLGSLGKSIEKRIKEGKREYENSERGKREIELSKKWEIEQYKVKRNENYIIYHNGGQGDMSMISEDGLFGVGLILPENNNKKKYESPEYDESGPSIIHKRP
jgi:hypothetical protein